MNPMISAKVTTKELSTINDTILENVLSGIFIIIKNSLIIKM